MNYQIIWFIIFLESQAYIVYDTGYINYQSHLDSFYFVKTIQFSQPFRNTPQIFFSLQGIWMDTGGNEYQFFCEAVNTQGFTARIISVMNKNVAVYYLYQAYDDMRIEIINVFNLNKPKGNTYPHKNVNAQTAILSLLSFGCTGPIDFKIFISKITKDSITVDLINNIVGNLQQIGFQILIGIEETIQSAEIKFVNQPDIPLNVLNFNNIPGIEYEFTATYQGFIYNPAYLLSQHKKILSFHPNNTFDYTIFIAEGTFAPCYSLQVLLIRYVKTIFTPLILQSAQFTQKSDPIFLNNPQICIKIEILNKIITQPEIYQTFIDKSIKTFNLQIEINCKNINKVESNFQNCQDCVFKQNYSLKHYCISNLTLFIFKFQLKQSILAYQQLKFTVEQSRFNLKQVLTNQIETEVELIDIILV